MNDGDIINELIHSLRPLSDAQREHLDSSRVYVNTTNNMVYIKTSYSRVIVPIIL